jgi:hypothetical protein
VRTKIVRGLVENYGVGVAEVARQVGFSISQGFEDPDETYVQLVNSVPSPAYESFVDQANIFRSVFDKKRLQPGKLNESSNHAPFWAGG